MSNVTRFKRTLTTTSALLALAACAPKRSAQTTTAVTPASARPVATDAAGPETVRGLLREHNHLVDLVNGAGVPSASWDVPRIEHFREWLNRLDEVERRLTEMDPRFAEAMRKEGHQSRIEGKRWALNELMRAPRD